METETRDAHSCGKLLARMQWLVYIAVGFTLPGEKTVNKATLDVKEYAEMTAPATNLLSLQCTHP